jgi:hypothetical protein
VIEALELQNFKGIAARQRIQFAPLTLLFGPNSAGKSSILQALIYLNELLKHGGADVDRTDLGGDVIELGGFARLVHRHETDREIVLRAEFTTPSALERLGRDLADFRFPNLDDEIESAWLELTIREVTAATFSGPLIERVVIGVGQTTVPLVELRAGDTLRAGEALIAGVNLAHARRPEELMDRASWDWPRLIEHLPIVLSTDVVAAASALQAPINIRISSKRRVAPDPEAGWKTRAFSFVDGSWFERHVGGVDADTIAEHVLYLDRQKDLWTIVHFAHDLGPCDVDGLSASDAAARLLALGGVRRRLRP